MMDFLNRAQVWKVLALDSGLELVREGMELVSIDSLSQLKTQLVNIDSVSYVRLV